MHQLPAINSIKDALPCREQASELLTLLENNKLSAVNHRVYTTALNGEQLFLKFYNNNKRLKEFKLKVGLQTHEALTEFSAFKQIEALGIPTIKPCIALSYTEGSFQKSLIITQDFNRDNRDYKSLKDCIATTPKRCDYFLDRLKETLLLLLRNNLFYLDVHLENFLCNGEKIAIMDAEGTFLCPDRPKNICAKFLDMSSRNLLHDLTELGLTTSILKSFFISILEELHLSAQEAYALLRNRQRRKSIDMYIRWFKGKSSLQQAIEYNTPLPHLGLFSQANHE